LGCDEGKGKLQKAPEIVNRSNGKTVGKTKNKTELMGVISVCLSTPEAISLARSLPQWDEYYLTKISENPLARHIAKRETSMQIDDNRIIPHRTEHAISSADVGEVRKIGPDGEFVKKSVGEIIVFIQIDFDLGKNERRARQLDLAIVGHLIEQKGLVRIEAEIDDQVTNYDPTTASNSIYSLSR
jgi:hypothetical protein